MTASRACFGDLTTLPDIPESGLEGKIAYTGRMNEARNGAEFQGRIKCGNF